MLGSENQKALCSGARPNTCVDISIFVYMDNFTRETDIVIIPKTEKLSVIQNVRFGAGLMR